VIRRVLLDTHALVWWVNADPRLSAWAADVIADPAIEVLVSAASAWEVAIKAARGNLKLAQTPAQFIATAIVTNRFKPLPITIEHAAHVFTLPMLHKDPFDRLLVAQAQLEGVPIVTDDPIVARYAVTVEW
jgi:PIN domain nuclease of toxin-antitoxin system